MPTTRHLTVTTTAIASWRCGRTIATRGARPTSRVAVGDALQLYRGYTVVVEYVYDGLYRLTQADYSDGMAYAYAYDAVGNRTAYTDTQGEVVTYTFDAANRLSAQTQAGVQTGYTWSDRGDLLNDNAVAMTPAALVTL